MIGNNNWLPTDNGLRGNQYKLDSFAAACSRLTEFF